MDLYSLWFVILLAIVDGNKDTADISVILIKISHQIACMHCIWKINSTISRNMWLLTVRPCRSEFWLQCVLTAKWVRSMLWQIHLNFFLIQNKQNFVYLDICHFIHTKNEFYYKFFFANSFACVPRAFSIFSKPFDSSKSPSSFFTFWIIGGPW